MPSTQPDILECASTTRCSTPSCAPAHTYRDVDAPEGALLRVTVTGEAGGSWDLLRRENAWQLGTGSERAPDAEAAIPQEITWGLFTRGIGKDEARPLLRVEGVPDLGWPVLQLLAVMA
jgi:hypothetical protein